MRVYARVRVSMRENVHAYAWICMDMHEKTK